jgi:hypothetical protein
MTTDETRIIGNLPNLRMEIVHRQEPDGSAEHMTISLSATPSFRAAEGLLLGGFGPSALAFSPLSQASMADPMALWTGMTQAMRAMGLDNPWLALLPGRDSR